MGIIKGRKFGYSLYLMAGHTKQKTRVHVNILRHKNIRKGVRNNTNTPIICTYLVLKYQSILIGIDSDRLLALNLVRKNLL